jgi:hypothetical protein
MVQKDGRIRSTGPRMRRYFFTVEEAAGLVVTALEHMEVTGGRVLSRRMKAAQISDLLDVFVAHHGGDWVEVAGRPGDKPDESLVGELEAPMTREVKLDGVAHCLLGFGGRVEGGLAGPLSTRDAPRLSRAEMQALVTHEPAF